MVELLNLLRPEACFEWGAGHSTEIMWKHPAVKTLDSVENDPDYLRMVKEKFDVEGVTFQFEDDVRYYPIIRGDHSNYGLVFIDGRYRSKCLVYAHHILRPRGVVILHDAERVDYEEAMFTYKHRIFTDTGNTAVLINEDDLAAKIRQVLSTHTA